MLDGKTGCAHEYLGYSCQTGALPFRCFLTANVHSENRVLKAMTPSTSQHAPHLLPVRWALARLKGEECNGNRAGAERELQQGRNGNWDSLLAGTGDGKMDTA